MKKPADVAVRGPLLLPDEPDYFFGPALGAGARLGSVAM